MRPLVHPARCRPLAWAVPLAAVALAGCGGGGGDSTGSAQQKATRTPSGAERQASAASATANLQALESAYHHVVTTLSPSVVQVETNQGLGSGIVFDDRGDVVTNAHVVGSAKTFTLTLASGKRAKAQLVGRWVPNDLAVVRTGAGGLRPASFADSSKLLVGDIAVALGNPLGLRSSVTQGIVSSLGRTVSEGNGVTLPAAIQTSAAINPGNSGGALADIEGRVIGIPTLAATDPELGGQAPGIGFAIPSNTITRIARQLVANGRVVNSGRAALGVEVATVTGGGVVIVRVTSGGAAAKAGLRPRDMIVSVNGRPTPTSDDLSTILANFKPGQQVTVAVRAPDGSRETHKVTLGQLQG